MVVGNPPGSTMRLHLSAFLVGLLITATASAAPAVGDPAPNWTLPGSDGQTHTLADLRGRHVVIAFFPKAFTGG